MTTNESPSEIMVRGRSYRVSTQTAKNGEKQYILTGKRGATYGTMRNVKRPELMFLVDCRGFGIKPGDVWLTDAGGTLRVL